MANIESIRYTWKNDPKYNFDVGHLPNLIGPGDISGQTPRFGWRAYTANYNIDKFTILAGYW